ncbi:MAG: hypothetical protein U0163_04460 [Gemmatimonadaceae bacterium]
MLDKMGVETMVVRVSMGPGLPSPRFQWVPFVDALMFPLDNTALMKTPDQKAFFPLEEKLLARYYKESGLAEIDRGRSTNISPRSSVVRWSDTSKAAPSAKV